MIYPHKFVLSISNKYTNNVELLPNQFSGGNETDSFHISLGFQIFHKPPISTGTKWLGVSILENWLIGMANKVWGVDDLRAKNIKKFRVRYKVLVFVKEMRIAGICEVTEGYYFDDSKVWKDGIYPHRIKIKPLIIPKHPINIRLLF